MNKPSGVPLPRSGAWFGFSRVPRLEARVSEQALWPTQCLKFEVEGLQKNGTHVCQKKCQQRTTMSQVVSTDYREAFLRMYQIIGVRPLSSWRMSDKCCEQGVRSSRFPHGLKFIGVASDFGSPDAARSHNHRWSLPCTLVGLISIIHSVDTGRVLTKFKIE